MTDLKYIVYCTASINSVIFSDNLRGEGRFERNVLDALVRDGRDVYLTDLKRFWKSSQDKPENLGDYADIKDLTNTVFIGHNPPMRLDIPTKCHRYILQWFNGPDDNADGEFLELVKDNPRSVVGTYNFLLKHKQYESKLGVENVRCIQGPAVPQVYQTDNFDKPYLLWSSKILWAWMCTPDMSRFLIGLFKWVADVLEKNPQTKLMFLLGTMGGMETKEEVMDWFWASEVSRPLYRLKDRVGIFYQIDWSEVFPVLEQTKLIINPHFGYGGPPYEAGAYGIPIILTKNGHPFQGRNKEKMFPEILEVYEHYSLNEVLPILNKLYYNRTYYSSVGNAYRNYVEKWGTYSAYLRQLDEVCGEFGWV